MPHIAIEVSPVLFDRIDWDARLEALHQALADAGWARLEDLKSRVQPVAAGLCGGDRQAQQLIATLILTNPRPPEICLRMAQLVHDRLSQAVEDSRHAGWVQCCVLLRELPKTHYFKRQWQEPATAAESLKDQISKPVEIVAGLGLSEEARP